MNYEEFTANVEKWQEEKGIYEHGTPLAQALKAVSEVGELADAVIKGDDDALKDAIGDVMVCLVGVAKMTGCDIGSVDEAQNWEYSDDDIQKEAAFAAAYVAEVCFYVALNDSEDRIVRAIMASICQLNSIAIANNLTLMECCESSWNEIKDRKGRMVEGGAFVKEGDV